MMKRDFLNPNWDLVAAKEYAEQFINGYLADITLYAVKNKITIDNEPPELVDYEGKLMDILRKVRRANNKDEINDFLNRVLQLKGAE